MVIVVDRARDDRIVIMKIIIKISSKTQVLSVIKGFDKKKRIYRVISLYGNIDKHFAFKRAIFSYMFHGEIIMSINKINFFTIHIN